MDPKSMHYAASNGSLLGLRSNIQAAQHAVGMAAAGGCTTAATALNTGAFFAYRRSSMLLSMSNTILIWRHVH
jgi:hypothetical protein